MAAPASVPEWLRPDGLPSLRMPSAQALQRLVAGNVRYAEQRTGAVAPPGPVHAARFPFALVVGCLCAGAAGERLFAESPGAVQCVRTAGPSAGDDTVAAVEYAALVENVGVVLVLTHRQCPALAAAKTAAAAGDLALPGTLTAWARGTAAGTRSTDGPAVGHARALRASLRRLDSLLSLTRSGQLAIAAGVLDGATGAIEFLPDEPEEVPDDVAPSAGGWSFGS